MFPGVFAQDLIVSHLELGVVLTIFRGISGFRGNAYYNVFNYQTKNIAQIRPSRMDKLFQSCQLVENVRTIRAGGWEEGNRLFTQFQAWAKEHKQRREGKEKHLHTDHY
ncbi:hypothetical protein BaRGS_00030343 [Batillaria attramentaria]|uniref:Uncharacterized protein n=1 Tax=Batillaria attramentaria TaxID=370345 RepID=A0ABD0JU86_9CAEN